MFICLLGFSVSFGFDVSLRLGLTVYNSLAGQKLAV